jgi:hypothetical protein
MKAPRVLIMLLIMLISMLSFTPKLQLVSSEKSPVSVSQTLNSSIVLDVYTQRGGNGHLEPSDAFGPQEDVFLYGNLTSDLEPLQDMYVRFEVFYPNETLVLDISNITDGNGIATTSFRLPWPCENPEDNFGNWTVLAEADVAETTVNDTLRFEYGWLAEVTSLETGLNVCGSWLPKSFFCREDQMDVKVELKTIRFVPTNVTIGVIVLDGLAVPILQKLFNHTILTKEENISIAIGIVPRWARFGEGALYASVLDEEGLQMSPVKSIKALIEPGEVEVTVPGDYSTIQEAIWASDYWTTIVVSSGVYNEHIVLNKPISLLAEENGEVIIDGEGSGIGFNVTSSCTEIIGFTILNQDIGIYVSNSCLNTFYHNNFINNTVQVHLENSYNNTWDNGCEGNYWSNYNGTDLDGDGIGDTELPWEGVDNYPLMNSHWNLGDVDHDLDVDLYDAVRLLTAYGSKLGDEEYNPHCDIAEPYGQINLYDAVLLLANYGKKYP